MSYLVSCVDRCSVPEQELYGLIVTSTDGTMQCSPLTLRTQQYGNMSMFSMFGMHLEARDSGKTYTVFVVDIAFGVHESGVLVLKLIK